MSYDPFEIQETGCVSWSESREHGRRDDGRDTGTGVPVSGAIMRFLLTLGWGWGLLQSLEQKKNMI